MEGSFLSQPAVIAASRAFVCVRPQTYENKAEAALMKALLSNRSGSLENTTFALLAPDGKPITRGSRSPGRLFDGPEEFTAFLKSTAAEYEPKAKALDALPLHADLRLGVNVAACDLRPLVVLRAKDAKALKSLQSAVADLAWKPEHVGLQHFVVLEGSDPLPNFPKLELPMGLSVLQADPYGDGAKVLATAPPGSKSSALAKAMSAGRAAHDPADKDRRRHVREASRKGLEWDSELPVSDPQSRKRRGK